MQKLPISIIKAYLSLDKFVCLLAGNEMSSMLLIFALSPKKVKSNFNAQFTD